MAETTQIGSVRSTGSAVPKADAHTEVHLMLNRGNGRTTEMQALQVIQEGSRPAMSLELPKGTAFEDWVEIGRRLCASSQVLNWHIGDWWAFGTEPDPRTGRPRYGERAKLAAEGIFGREFQTLRNAGTVARAFKEVSRRRDVLTWSHHIEVAPFSQSVADAFLDRAENEGMSVRDLRKAVIIYRTEQAEQRRRPDIIDVRPERPTVEGIEGTTLAEMVVELAEALGRERALSERESKFLQHGLKAMTERNPRQTEPWTAENEIELTSMLREGLRPRDISPRIDRTIGAIWRQIGRMGGIGRMLGKERGSFGAPWFDSSIASLSEQG